MGFLHNQKCDGFGQPPEPEIFVLSGTYSQSGGVTSGRMAIFVRSMPTLPEGCELWYEMRIYDPQAPAGFPRYYSFALETREGAADPNAELLVFSFQMRSASGGLTPGPRGDFARAFSSGGTRPVYITTRATSGAGLQSGWSTQGPKLEVVAP
jgi:hypothetical protein